MGSVKASENWILCTQGRPPITFFFRHHHQQPHHHQLHHLHARHHITSVPNQEVKCDRYLRKPVTRMSEVCSGLRSVNIVLPSPSSSWSSSPTSSSPPHPSIRRMGRGTGISPHHRCHHHHHHQTSPYVTFQVTCSLVHS